MNKEELDLLEIVFTLAIGECAYNDIDNIQKLEDKIKTTNNLCKKQKEVIDKAKKIIMQPNIEIREYHSCDMDYVYVNEQLLDILKEVE